MAEEIVAWLENIGAGASCDGVAAGRAVPVAPDTRPTGPPVRAPPRNLKAEEADFVDNQLAK